MLKWVKTEYKPNIYIQIWDLRNLRLPLFIYLFILIGCAMNLGQFVATQDSRGVSSRNRQKKEAFVGSIWSTLWIGTGFAQSSDVIALKIRSLKDAAPELRHSHWGKHTEEKAWRKQYWQDRHLLSQVFCQRGPWRSLCQLLITGACSQQHTCLSLHLVQSVSEIFVKLEQKKTALAAQMALCPLLVELMLATPGLLSSSTVSTMVFLATSFVEACAFERCFIKLELLTMDVDKHFGLGNNEHFTCMFLPFISRR